MAAARTYSGPTREALSLLGKQIQVARRERRMTEVELAERVGIARSTLQNIEKGSAKAEIGLVFEAATVVGIPLFTPDARARRFQMERLDDKLALLPRSVRPLQGRVEDDF